MAKTKRKSHKNSSQREKELEQQVRSLQKQLKQAEKFKFPQESDEKVYDSEDTFPELKKILQDCEECGPGKGKYDEFEIAGKTYGTCNVCGNRKRLK